MIRTSLTEMPPQRVYRLFARPPADRVNNRRTRAGMREWLTVPSLVELARCGEGTWDWPNYVCA